MIECVVTYSPGSKSSSNMQSLINVQYQPTTSPIITQTPVGPIIEGNNVTLTCTIQGGNPVATITWSCDGATQITPTGSPSTVDAISSVELATSKHINGHICTCTGRHFLWTNDSIQQHTITVYYEPTSSPSIMQTPPGPISESSTVILTCDIKGGNPLANITWSCEGSSPINPTGSPSTNKATSSVQLTVNSKDNGKVCTCIGNHPAWTPNMTTEHTLDVRYNPEITNLSVIDGNEIEENDTAIIQCNVESNPLSKVDWTYEDNTLNEGTHGVLQSNYTIQRAKCVNTGFYMCTATNIINMESYSDKKVIQLSVKCSPRRDTMFELPENQIRLTLGHHLKIQIHIVAYPPPVVEWRFRSADNSTTKTLSSNCIQTNMFKHTACFEQYNATEEDLGQYSIFVYNGVGNNFSYLFNVDPQGPPDMSSNVNTSCKVLSADILWTTGFHGGQQQQFYVLVLDVKTRTTKIYNTHQFGDEKNEVMSYNIALQPGLYSFRIFGNNSFGNATSGESTCQVNDKASESDSVIAVAAGTGSAAAALIIGVVVVIVVLRKRMANAKGNENSIKERLNMTPMDGERVVEGLQENDCYVPFRPKDIGAANYEVVEREDQSNANDVKGDSQETALYNIVDKKRSGKGATTSGEKTKDGQDENGDVHENFTNKSSSDNQKQNVSKDGLQYSQLVFNPLPNGSNFIVHGIEDKTIYAEVDTTQKIDPLPESDDEDKGNEA